MKLLVALTVAGLFAVGPAFAMGGCMDRKNDTTAQSTKQLPPAPTAGS